jgi:enterochelin esterase family protein
MNMRDAWRKSSVMFAGALVSVFTFASTLRAQVNPDWIEPFPSFRIAGNLYYVGSKGLASYLITTPRGHILINSDLETSVPLIRASVERLGFKFNDIRILLISHAHWDHDAGSAEVKRLTGATYMVMDGDVSVVESGGKTDFHYANQPTMLYPPAKVDRVLHDGDKVTLGGTTLVAHLTPGHTKGCTTWTMKVKEAGKTYDVVIIGSPNVNDGYKLVGNPSYPQIASDYERAFKVLKALPVDIFLGAHGSYFDLETKYARLKEGAVTPFVDRAGYKRYVADREEAFRTELAKQRAGHDTVGLVAPNADTTVAAIFKDTGAVNVFSAEGQTFKLQTPGQREALRAMLKKERALWQAGKPPDYKFLLRVGCFCPGTRGWLVMDVRSGQPLRAWDRTGKSVALTDWNTLSIDGLYDNLERSIDRNGQVQIAFDPRWHFPKFVHTVVLPGPDSWSTTEVRGFRPSPTTRPAPPTRDPDTPGFVSAKELPDDAVPPPDVDGNFIIGPTHTPALEMAVHEGVPRGAVHTFTMSSAESKIFPGIARDSGTFGTVSPTDPATLVVTTSHPAPYTRTVAVYVPAQYVPGAIAPFIVGADGPDQLLFTGLDNLIAQKRVPAMIAISIGNGGGDAQGSERSLEYDTMSGRYAEFVETEVLPLVERRYNVKLTRDPDGRATMGGSSGGAAAFIMAWYHPDLYHRVLAYSITATNQQWPHSDETPHGAWGFHESLIPNSPVKPIRVWMEVGDRDFLNPNVMRDEMHDWVVASENMARVLAAKGYHYQFVFARNAAHVDRGVKLQTLPEALEWLWNGYD